MEHAAPNSPRAVDGLGRVFGGVSLAHQTCLALELVLLDTLHDIKPMATPPHVRSPSTATTDGDNPQTMVITSLRSQVSDLVSQVTQLNSKLVQSYDRISDLEDNMHITSSTLRSSTLKISQLELERTQHLSALNTGLLVEKSHVTSELTRLMERATDEAARRGMAESARHEIEKDLDDLSAELFGRANTMVAEARLAQAKSERRVQDAEAVLKGAEEAVTSMQAQMQALREEKDRSDREIGKGKWIERAPPVSLRLLSTHVPYQEFLLFVAHLRQIRPVTPQAPPMATFLPLPFLARLASEDSDPTLRLDTAPSLNWLTRRSVTSAIHQSQLTVEPVSLSTLMELFAPPAYSTTQQQQTINITCALCGKSVLPPSHSPPSHSHAGPNGTPNSWRPTFFSKPSNGTPTKQQGPTIHSPTPSIATTASFYPPSNSSGPGPGRLSPPLTPPLPEPTLSPIYVFRLQPASAQSSQTQAATVYPLCTSGWCLARLRTTCELWRFVRTGVVDKVWEEEVPDAVLQRQGSANGTPTGKPLVPPRRRLPSSMNVGVGKLLGMASSALGKASGSGSVTPTKQGGGPPETPPKERKIGTPPPLPRRSDGRAARGDAEKSDADKPVDVDTVDKVAELRSRLNALVRPEASIADVTPEVAPPALDTSGKTEADEFLTPQGSPAQSPSAESTSNPTDVTVEPTQVPLPDSPAVATFAARGSEHPQTEVLTEELTAQAADDKPATPPVADGEPSRAAPDESSAAPAGESAPAPTPSTPPPPAPSALPPATPPRTASPAPALGTPSRIASPAPPPVPRRAARRAAPVPPGGASRPASMADAATPGEIASASGPAAAPTEPPKPIESDASAAQEPAPGPVVQDQAPAAQDLARAPVEAPLPLPVHPSYAPAPAPGVLPHDVPPFPPTHPPRETSEPSPPRVSPLSLSVEDRRASTLSERRESSPRRNPNTEEHEPYVGDATWEERTWKALVRLREDMFYARVGTVR